MKGHVLLSCLSLSCCSEPAISLIYSRSKPNPHTALIVHPLPYHHLPLLPCFLCSSQDGRCSLYNLAHTPWSQCWLFPLFGLLKAQVSAWLPLPPSSVSTQPSPLWDLPQPPYLMLWPPSPSISRLHLLGFSPWAHCHWLDHIWHLAVCWPCSLPCAAPTRTWVLTTFFTSCILTASTEPALDGPSINICWVNTCLKYR